MTFRWCGTALGVTVGFLSAANAHAWKPITHVYLAQQAVHDMLDDGEVTIERVDPTQTDPTKRVIGVVGKYKVDPKIMDAIKANPGVYYNGVIGPDVYPDLLTGQDIIHPPAGEDPKSNVHGTGTDYWWQRAWNSLSEPQWNNDATRAFVLGLYGHSCGDVFAHTFVNAHTGGIFELNENAMRHIILEGYLFQRTPDLAAHGFAPHKGKSLYDLVRDQGMSDELAHFNRAVLDPWDIKSPYDEHLPSGDVVPNPGDQKSKSLFWQFGRLKQKLNGTKGYYTQQRTNYIAEHEAAKIAFNKATAAASKAEKEYKAAKKEFDDLTNIDVKKLSWSDLKNRASKLKKLGSKADELSGHWLTAQKNSAAANITMVKAEAGIEIADAILKYVVPYFDEWIANIDEGLLAWPKVSHKYGQVLMFKDPNDKACPPKTTDAVCTEGENNWKPVPGKKCKGTIEVVAESLSDFWWAYGTRMVGMPTTPSKYLAEAKKYIKDFDDKVSQLIADAMIPFKEFTFNLKTRAATFAKVSIQKTWGVDLCKWHERWANPSAYIDDLFKQKGKGGGSEPQNLADSTRNANGRATNLAELNALMGLKATGAGGNERFNWRNFGPAFNTVTLIKLSFLPSAEINRLLKDLGSTQQLKVTPQGESRGIKQIKGDLNIMLGWIGGIDAGNQWGHPGDKRFVFARDCMAFGQVFIDHPGPHVAKSPDFEPNNPCPKGSTMKAPPTVEAPFTILGADRVEVEAGTSRHFDLSGVSVSNVQVTSLTGRGVPSGSITGQDSKGFTFVAPAWNGAMAPIQIKATAKAGTADVTDGVVVDVIQPPSIRPSISVVAAGDKVVFLVTTDKPTSFRVKKGVGHFGDDKRLSELKNSMLAKRSELESLRSNRSRGIFEITATAKDTARRAVLTAEISVISGMYTTESRTYYAPAEAKPGEIIEVEATVGTQNKEGGRTLTETFEIVAPLLRVPR